MKISYFFLRVNFHEFIPLIRKKHFDCVWICFLLKVKHSSNCSKKFWLIKVFTNEEEINILFINHSHCQCIFCWRKFPRMMNIVMMKGDVKRDVIRWWPFQWRGRSPETPSQKCYIDAFEWHTIILVKRTAVRSWRMSRFLHNFRLTGGWWRLE